MTRAWIAHGQSKSPEYQVYQTAKDRCTNPNSQRWESHGGRGIEFRFGSFEEFILELGTRPMGASVDRIDNDGHYEVGNVKWSTRSEQQKNKRVYEKGCTFHKDSGQWQVRFTFKGKYEYLGLFPTEALGIEARDKRLKELKEKYESITRYNVPESTVEEDFGVITNDNGTYA